MIKRIGLAAGVLAALTLTVLAGASKADPSREAVLKVLETYRTAMRDSSLETLAAAVHPDLTVMEGVHLNTSWADYRDHHIGPEMKEWKEFRIADPRLVGLTVDGDWAYAVTRATYTLVFPDKALVIAGAETFVLRKAGGAWTIRHIHSSGKKIREEKR